MQPQTPQHKLKNTPFLADISCFIGYAAMVYDAAYKKAKAKKQLEKDLNKFRGVIIEQGVNDLPACKLDIDEIRKCVARYGITDMGRNGQYLLDYTPTYKKVFRVRAGISKRLKKSPDKTFLLLYAFAGHGM